MRTVKEVSDISGVSVRTLHYYDSIGLLKPTKITESGYRLYNKSAMARLQTILLFRELDFSLKDIKIILDNPSFDLKRILDEQIELFEMQKKRIDGLISLAEELKRGELKMSFEYFDNSKLQQYSNEAKERWGDTDAYREYENRENKGNNADALMLNFAKFGRMKNMSADCDEVQNEVKNLQQFITDNYYTCTKEILAGLGTMYVGDERFRENIDSVGGEGTAEFVSEAITIYCEK